MTYRYETERFIVDFPCDLTVVVTEKTTGKVLYGNGFYAVSLDKICNGGKEKDIDNAIMTIWRTQL